MKMVFSIFMEIRNSFKNSSELTKICDVSLFFANFRYQISQHFRFLENFRENRPTVTVFSTPGCFLLEVRVKLGVVAEGFDLHLVRKKFRFFGEISFAKVQYGKNENGFFHLKIRQNVRKFAMFRYFLQIFRYRENHNNSVFSKIFAKNRPTVTVFSTPGCFLLEVSIKLRGCWGSFDLYFVA